MKIISGQQIEDNIVLLHIIFYIIIYKIIDIRI